MTQNHHRRFGLLARRQALQLIGLGGLGMMLAACGGKQEPSPTTSAGVPGDISARFAGYEPADEPDGDLAKVVWPAFVTKAGPEVQRLYAFQVENGALMRYMPCFCGCHKEDGHRNNRDCYIEAVNADGSVVFDSMAPT